MLWTAAWALAYLITCVYSSGVLVMDSSTHLGAFNGAIYDTSFQFTRTVFPPSLLRSSVLYF